MPRCMRVTLFPAPQSNWQPEVTLEALSEPELVNLDGPQGLSPIWYAPPGPPRTPDADIDPPQLTKMEITRIRYRTGGRPREEYEMTEEELSDMFAGTNIHTERGYELGSSSSDGSPANTSGPEHPPRNLLNNSLNTVSVQSSQEDSARKLSDSSSKRARGNGRYCPYHYHPSLRQHHRSR